MTGNFWSCITHFQSPCCKLMHAKQSGHTILNQQQINKDENVIYLLLIGVLCELSHSALEITARTKNRGDTNYNLVSCTQIQPVSNNWKYALMGSHGHTNYYIGGNLKIESVVLSAGWHIFTPTSHCLMLFSSIWNAHAQNKNPINMARLDPPFLFSCPWIQLASVIKVTCTRLIFCK